MHPLGDTPGHKPFEVEPPCDTFLGVRAVIRALQEKQPTARIILHPNAAGYAVWRDAVLPVFKRVCGKPAIVE